MSWRSKGLRSKGSESVGTNAPAARDLVFEGLALPRHKKTSRLITLPRGCGPAVKCGGIGYTYHKGRAYLLMPLDVAEPAPARWIDVRLDARRLLRELGRTLLQSRCLLSRGRRRNPVSTHAFVREQRAAAFCVEEGAVREQSLARRGARHGGHRVAAVQLELDCSGLASAHRDGRQLSRRCERRGASGSTGKEPHGSLTRCMAFLCRSHTIRYILYI